MLISQQCSLVYDNFIGISEDDYYSVFILVISCSLQALSSFCSLSPVFNGSHIVK